MLIITHSKKLKFYQKLIYATANNVILKYR